MAISSPGIGSNLDVNTIVSGLMKTEQGPLTLVNKQKTDYQTKISAYGSLKGVLSSFQSTLSNLASVSKFNTQKAESSDTTVMTVTSSGTAVESSYAVKVNQLAQSQKIAMAGVSTTTSPIGTGKLTISLGSYSSQANTFAVNANQPAVTIDITPANNTLAGIRDAINGANVGVSATIVNDGQTNRLVLSAKNSGTSNSIKITVADDDATNLDASGLSKLAFDPTTTIGAGKNLSVLQAAKDAIIEIDGVVVTKPSNVISDAVDGITFNLLKESPSTAVTLGVSRDQSTVEASVTSFVKAFNDANKVLKDLTKYDPTSKSGGVLVGDAATRSVASQIKQVLSSSIGGAGGLKTLNDVGVSFQRDGTLLLDTSKLKLAINNNAKNIPALFAVSGKASDSLINQTGQTEKTVAGIYAINVSRLATQGNVQGSNAPGLTITQGVNDHIDLNIDSVAYSFELSAGTYNTTDDIVAEMQTRLSAAGSTAKVETIGGNIQVSSANYGSSTSVILTGGNGAANLFGAPTTTAGLDTAGTINGVAATGAGKNLTGATGDVSEGLAIQVNGGALGSRGSVNYSQGYAYQLNKLMKNLLGSDGILTSRTDGINSSISRLTKQQEALQDRLTKIEKRYREQFTSLDTLIGSMQQTSSFLTQQIAQLQK